jgi:hypothetical protein
MACGREKAKEKREKGPRTRNEERGKRKKEKGKRPGMDDVVATSLRVRATPRRSVQLPSPLV